MKIIFKTKIAIHCRTLINQLLSKYNHSFRRNFKIPQCPFTVINKANPQIRNISFWTRFFSKISLWLNKIFQTAFFKKVIMSKRTSGITEGMEHEF